nr:MAG TPA: hypothetical protein [Caudoviricetes sp.]
MSLNATDSLSISTMEYKALRADLSPYIIELNNLYPTDI